MVQSTNNYLINHWARGGIILIVHLRNYKSLPIKNLFEMYLIDYEFIKECRYSIIY